MNRNILLVAFWLSGASGLIYQTVWVRMLTRYVGSTTPAVATVLGVFMAGLALGSLLVSRWADRVRSPLRWYAALEVALSLVGLAVSLLVIHGSGHVYVQACSWFAGAEGGDLPLWKVTLAQVVFVTVCLLPATILMGATLPLLVAHVTRRDQEFQVGLGKLYAINTWGAVAGALAAGLVLLGEFGEMTSLVIAAVVNLSAGGFALLSGSGLGRTSAGQEVSPPGPAQPSAEHVVTPYSSAVHRLALLTLFVSGFTALAYEILWTRWLVLLLQTSIYAFTGMLATFLAGIAWGSWDSTRSRALRQRPLAFFGLLEVAIGCWAVIGMVAFPYFDALGSTMDPNGSLVQMVLSRLALVGCLFMVLPIAFFFGRQFPAAVRTTVRNPEQPGGSTGFAYGINTLGTILGSLATGFFLIPLVGTATTMLVLAGLNVGLGLVLLAVAPRQERGRLPLAAACLTVVFVVAAGLAGDPYRKAMEARVARRFDDGQISHYFEGSAGTTVAAGSASRPLERALLVNGVGMSELVSETKVMAHLPYQLADHPRRCLVICFGMGTTFRSASQYPDLQIDAVDIVPEVFQCFDSYHPDARKVLSRPNYHFHPEDGRNYLLVHRDQYDMITMDPPPPLYSAGAVNLYTREFFQLAKNRLTPGGVLSVWIPPEIESEILMVMKSFHEVFAECEVWGGVNYPGFYLIGANRPLHRTPEELKDLARRVSATRDLGEWDQTYCNPETVEHMFLLDSAGVDRLVAGVPAVTDNRPYTEFPLWRRLFLPSGRRVLTAEMVRDPTDLIWHRKSLLSRSI